MTDNCQLIFSTCPDEAVAAEIAGQLVGNNLAACCNILPGITSVFRWQGKLEKTAEVLLVIKSNSSNYPAVEQLVQQLHPYELPEIVAVSVQQGLPGYLEWLNNSVN